MSFTHSLKLTNSSFEQNFGLLLNMACGPSKDEIKVFELKCMIYKVKNSHKDVSLKNMECPIEISLLMAQSGIDRQHTNYSSL